MARATRGLTPWQRFKRLTRMESTGHCWPWLGAVGPDGYGSFYDGEKVVRAHRWSYQYECGPIPEGHELDHLCGFPGCVNPTHLEPVTHRENVLRGNSNAAKQARRTHCIRGHQLAGENVYTYPTKNGTRRLCRVCRKLRGRGLIGRTDLWRKG